MKQIITAKGAGYTINRKAWFDASKEALDKKIEERLRVYGRSVTPDELLKRLNTDNPSPYTMEELQARICLLCEKGIVRQDGSGYRV